MARCCRNYCLRLFCQHFLRRFHPQACPAITTVAFLLLRLLSWVAALLLALKVRNARLDCSRVGQVGSSVFR